MRALMENDSESRPITIGRTAQETVIEKTEVGDGLPAWDAGANEYLTKLFTREALQEMMTMRGSN